MKYSFNVKLNSDDKFNSSMNFIKISKTYYFDILFTLVAFIAIIYTIFTGTFFTMQNYKKVLLIVCFLIFPVIQPLIIYIKTKNEKALEIPISITFDEDNINISSNSENVTLTYDKIYNFIKFKNMIVILYDSLHGQIIPDRFINCDKNEFYNFVDNKIKEAKRKLNA